MKILLIEDDELTRTVTEEVLNRYHFEVISRDSGVDIKNTAKQVDLVITDVGGIENFDGIVSHCKEINKPLIIVSGHAEFADLQKPYKPKDLIALIQERMK